MLKTNIVWKISSWKFQGLHKKRRGFLVVIMQVFSSTQIYTDLQTFSRNYWFILNFWGWSKNPKIFRIFYFSKKSLRLFKSEFENIIFYRFAAWCQKASWRRKCMKLIRITEFNDGKCWYGSHCQGLMKQWMRQTTLMKPLNAEDT